MSNQQVLDYIQQQRQQGVSDGDIKNALIQAGWQEGRVSELLGGSAAPPPPESERVPQPEPEESFESNGPQLLNPKAVWIFFFSWVARLLSAAVILMVFLGGVVFEILGTTGIHFIIIFTLGVIVLVIVIAYIWAKLTYRNYKYELAENEFKKESGVIMKKYVNIPYDQIQNIREFRGVLDRILNLADINVYTAGSASYGGGGRYGGSGEGYLPGLSRETADKLRDELSKRSRVARGRR